jgi:hypothetical protein
MRTADPAGDDRFSRPRQRADGVGGGRLVRGFRLGERQEAGPLAVYPIFLDEAGGGGSGTPRYITLHQALREGSIEISEVSRLGWVPQLRVVNRGNAHILMLGGEELRGAKQDRVVSTSVLVGQRTTTMIPVACTEKGRWSYSSRTFADSDVVADRRVRWAMSDSVTASLRAGGGASADQRRVWDEVDALHARQATASETGAMADAYISRRRELEETVAAFPLVEGQNGVLVVHGPRAVGLDVVSEAPQFAELHGKLLRSYAFEALVMGGEPADTGVAEAFLERISALRAERYPGVDMGEDVRYEGLGVVGSSLVHGGHVVHSAFFDVDGIRRSTGRRPAASQTGGRSSAGLAAGRRQAAAREYDRQHVVTTRRGSAEQDLRDREDARRGRILAAHIGSLSGFELVPFDVPFGHMGATLADAVLQEGLTTGSGPAPAAQRLRRAYPTARTTSAFSVLLESAEPSELWGAGDARKVRALEALVQLFLDEQVETEDDLRDWLDREGSKRRLSLTASFGERAFQYLRFLSGAADAIAVDRWFWRVLDGSGVRTYGFHDGLGLYEEAAAILGVSLPTLQYSLWRHGTSRRWKA